MEEELVHLTAEQAISCLYDGGDVHVYINAAFGLIGADWRRDKILHLFQTAEDIQIGGRCCRAAGHGIVVFPKGAKHQSDLYFVRCDDKKLSQFDTNKK